MSNATQMFTDALHGNHSQGYCLPFLSRDQPVLDARISTYGKAFKLILTGDLISNSNLHQLDSDDVFTWHEQVRNPLFWHFIGSSALLYVLFQICRVLFTLSTEIIPSLHVCQSPPSTPSMSLRKCTKRPDVNPPVHSASQPAGMGRAAGNCSWHVRKSGAWQVHRPFPPTKPRMQGGQ